MDGYEEPYDDLRRRTWARLLAAILIAALVMASGWYVFELLTSPDASLGGEPTQEDISLLDRPARSVACGTMASGITPVDDAPAAEQIPAIIRNVERLRQLEFEADVSTEFLPPKQVTAEINEINAAHYTPPEIERDETIAKLVGLIPEDSDLEDILEDVSGQVAGFYDPSDERMVVNAENRNEPLNTASELTLAHELQHALADQIFGLPDEEEIEGPDLDKVLAERALTEGDATLLQQHYASSAIDPDDAVEILSDPATEQAMAQLGEIPYPVRRTFEFPYTYGLAFVCDLYGRGGWAAVDEAYANRPTTTAQVLFPERYRTQESAWPVQPSDGPPGWVEREDAAVGAADLLFLFEAPGGHPARALSEPLARAADWVGGRMQMWSESRRGTEGLLLMSLVQRNPGGRLCDSMQAWYLKAFPGTITETGAAVNLAVDGAEQDAAIVCEDRGVKVAIGPDLEIILAVLGNPTTTAAR